MKRGILLGLAIAGLALTVIPSGVLTAGPQGDGKVRIRGLFVIGHPKSINDNMISGAATNDVGSKENSDPEKAEGLIDYLGGQTKENLVNSNGNKWPTKDQGWIRKDSITLKSPTFDEIKSTLEKIITTWTQLELEKTTSKIIFPESLKDRIEYDPKEKRLIFRGLMKEEEKNLLLREQQPQLTASDKKHYKTAVNNKLFRESQYKPDDDDILIFVYDGHGSKIKDNDNNKDEPQNDTKSRQGLDEDNPKNVGPTNCDDPPCDELIAIHVTDKPVDDNLKELFAGIPGTKVLIFNSCLSGGLADGTSDLPGDNTIVLMASGTNEYAYGTNFSFAHGTSVGRWHSLFIGALLAGLEEGKKENRKPQCKIKGGDVPSAPVKADANWNCEVTVEEWFKFAKGMVEEKMKTDTTLKAQGTDKIFNNAEQTPDMKSSPQDLPKNTVIFIYTQGWTEKHVTRLIKEKERRGEWNCGCSPSDIIEPGMPTDVFNIIETGADEPLVQPSSIGCIGGWSEIGFTNDFPEPVTVSLKQAPPEFNRQIQPFTLEALANQRVDIHDFPPGKFVWAYSLDQGITFFGTSVLFVDPEVEVDFFPNSLAAVQINTPFVFDTMTLTGPTTVVVDLESLADTDANDREQVPAEIVQMELTGRSDLLGPIILRLRDSASAPFKQSTGEIEENMDTQTGRLDVPPFDPTAGSADSFFDVFFEIELQDGTVLHNEDPKRMQANITHKPPRPGETYEGPNEVELFDEDGNPTDIVIREVSHTPVPEEDCTNRTDDDGDELVDCDDPDCADDPACVVPTPALTPLGTVAMTIIFALYGIRRLRRR